MLVAMASMSTPNKIGDLTPKQLHELVQNAVGHALIQHAELQNVAPPDPSKARQVELLQRIADKGINVRGGVAGGVFMGLLLWTVFPAVLFGIALFAGLLAR